MFCCCSFGLFLPMTLSFTDPAGAAFSGWLLECLAVFSGALSLPAICQFSHEHAIWALRLDFGHGSTTDPIRGFMFVLSGLVKGSLYDPQLFLAHDLLVGSRILVLITLKSLDYLRTVEGEYLHQCSNVWNPIISFSPFSNVPWSLRLRLFFPRTIYSQPGCPSLPRGSGSSSTCEYQGFLKGSVGIMIFCREMGGIQRLWKFDFNIIQSLILFFFLDGRWRQCQEITRTMHLSCYWNVPKFIWWVTLKYMNIAVNAGHGEFWSWW